MVSGLAFMLTAGGLITTVTVVVAVAVPTRPVAVIVYIVVSKGVTVTDPFSSTIPISGSITQDTEFSELQTSVAEPPVCIASGSAIILTAGGTATVTTTLAVSVSKRPVAVIVYTVVSEGVTVTDPFKSTIPISGFI